MTATVLPFPGTPATAELLRRAIRERRLVAFTLHGLARRAEPHDFGVINGATKLFFYQVGGASRSGRPIGWRWAILTEIAGLTILDEHFDGPRDQPSARHVQWDHLIASVSREV